MVDKKVTAVIFGGTGDLVQQKLMVALFDLFNNDLINKNLQIVGFSRKELSNDDYRQFAKEILVAGNRDEDQVNKFLSHIFYKYGDLNNLDSYQNLAEYLNELDAEEGVCSNKLLYLAIPPNFYRDVFNNLSKSGMTTPCVSKDEDQNSWSRVLVEKPFGNDIDDAAELDQLLGSLFSEDQIFRIDHYLAKETMQNILTFRFANSMFNEIWNNKNIDKINIRIHEEFGVRDRGGFYDKTGALRDVGQNHILQMLALIAMEDPKSLDPKSIRKARADVLRKVSVDNDEITRAQYEGYLNEKGIDENSLTETFFRIKANVKNKKLKNIPIILESGKGLSETKTDIEIIFKEKESCACPSDDDRSHNNRLIFNIKPEDGIKVRFWVKKPGFKYELVEKDLSFMYDKENEMLPDPYERVLLDCVRGDQTLFPNTEEVKLQWKIITPICSMWDGKPLVKYKKGQKAENIK